MNEADEKRIREGVEVWLGDDGIDGVPFGTWAEDCKLLLAEIDRLRIENQHLNERLGEAEINVKGAEFGEGQAMAEVELLKSRLKDAAEVFAGLQRELVERNTIQVDLTRALTTVKEAISDMICELQHKPEPCHPACRLCTRDMPDWRNALKEIEEIANP